MFGHDDTQNSHGTQSNEPANDSTMRAPTGDNDTVSVSNDTPDYMTTEPSLTLPASLSQGMPAAATPLTAPAPLSDNPDLISIKQGALQELKPLVGHLNQTPEERFRTTMMMIQAADDQSLIPQAYEAAKSISDEKVRAQALLDVVNEINYFTTQNAQ